MVLLALGVLSIVALPQLLAGKTIFAQGRITDADQRRRELAAKRASSAGGDSVVTFGPDQAVSKARLRAPIGWAESSPGPRHAR